MLFNVYVYSLVDALRSSDLGCHIGGEYIGCVVYADDIILISASFTNLQKMLDICYMQGDNLDILFNVNKSYLSVVGNIYRETLPHYSSLQRCLEEILKIKTILHLVGFEKSKRQKPT